MKKPTRGKTPTRFTVDVTDTDIERAHRNDSYKCVVAQAIARTVSDATNIEVDTQTIRFTVDGERRIHLTPYVVAGYVIAFDAGDPIEPFSFQLRDPRRARRRIRTDAGRSEDRARHAAAKAAKGPNESVRASQESVVKNPQAPQESVVKGPNESARAPLTRTDGGRKPPPRVFKTKRRAYGHRLLRINQEDTPEAS